MSLESIDRLLMDPHSLEGTPVARQPPVDSQAARIKQLAAQLLEHMRRASTRGRDDPAVRLAAQICSECDILDFPTSTTTEPSPTAVITIRRNSQGGLVETVHPVCTGCSNFSCVLELQDMNQIRTLDHIALGSRLAAMKKDLKLNKNTLTEIIRKLSGACQIRNQFLGPFNRCAVDETYFGN